ncbi:MAG TPA: hypothetical protein EYN79_09825 [Planctomycetes bacterium]|nr:hypothetical protein [Planctomycetota bacterium]HIN80700.1 hypothetical protein [Planctomycetota bacterium]
MKKLVLLLMFLLPLLLLPAQEVPPTPPATDEALDLPAVAGVIEKLKAASGGEKAWEGIKNRRTTGKVVIPQAGMNAQTVSYISAAGVLRERLVFPDFGEFLQGVDGNIGWANDPIQGPRLLGDAELKQYQRMTRLHPLLKIDQDYEKIEIKEREKVGDLDCLHVVFTVKDSKRLEHWWVDEEKYYLRKLSTIITSPMGEIPITTTLGDYREIDGVALPHASEIEQGLQKIIVTIEKYEHNVEISAEDLAIPAEVQALLDRKAAREKEKEKEGAADPGKEGG